jgi:hypothetical protein
MDKIYIVLKYEREEASMDTKTKIIIIAGVVIVIIALIINGVTGKSGENENNENTSEETVDNTNTAFFYEEDAETGEYIVYDKETGNEIGRVIDGGELKSYKDIDDSDISEMNFVEAIQFNNENGDENVIIDRDTLKSLIEESELSN